MRKIFQKRLLDIIASPWGTGLCSIGLFVLVISVVQLLQVAFRLPGTPICVSCSNMDFSDNLRSTSYQDRMCLPNFDIVYTWVNGSDPILQKSLDDFTEQLGQSAANDSRTAKGGHRFRDNEELRYSLRSIWKNAPWVRKIFVVTNGQVPSWLNIDHPRITIVTHAQLFALSGSTNALPTFSSPAIEAHLHLIPDLADRFLYFNDDVFLGQEVWPDDFYTHTGGQKAWLAWNVPDCAPGCPDSWQGDGYCDASCNVTECNFDAGDCENVTASTTSSWYGFNNRYTSASGYCSVGCPNSWIGDKVCDRSCKVEECGWDAGDCSEYPVYSNLLGYEIAPSISVPQNSIAAYVNLSSVFSTVTTTKKCDDSWVRAAVTKKDDMYLSVVFDKFTGNETQSCSIEIVGVSHDASVETRDLIVYRHADTKNDDGIIVISQSAVDSIVQTGRTLLSFPIDETTDDVESLLVLMQNSVEVQEISASVDVNSSFEELISIEEIKRVEIKQLVRRDLLSLAESSLQNHGTDLLDFRELEAETAQTTPSQRKLLDEFADSLRFVSSLYNEYFGRQSRKVMAHMPHLIDRHIMSELQSKWPAQWNSTMYHRFRQSDDMQYAFSYFYYLIQSPRETTIKQFYDTELDLDGDGYLSTDEVKSVNRLLSEYKSNQFHTALFECLADENAISVVVDFHALESCQSAVDIIAEHIAGQRKFKHELGNMDDVTFYMMGNNGTHVQDRLKSILSKGTKFICLNDDMDDPSSEVVDSLKAFYLTYFPIPSPFEHKAGVINEFLYIDNYTESTNSSLWLLTGFVCLLFFLGLLYLQFRKGNLHRE